MARTRLPKTHLNEFVEGKGRRFRVRARSEFIGGTFSMINALTRYDVEGREHLLEAIERTRSEGRGLVTVSNHMSLFDDPMVHCAVLGIRHFTVQTKCWWSTACASNFDPHASGMKNSLVRKFSEVSNMVFFARAYKGARTERASEALSDVLRPRLGWKRHEALGQLAAARGTDVESMLRGFLTTREGEEPSSLDQLGLIESIARVSVGDWLHFFPEGGRSRNMALRPARAGVGKVLYHSSDAEVVPLCIYGTQDVLPVGAVMPRPFRKVVVSVGRPLNPAILASFRTEPATPETFARLSQFAMAGVAALRPQVLVRYMGAESAFKLLEEEQAETALAAAEGTRIPSDRVTPVPTVGPEPEIAWPSADRMDDRTASHQS